MAYKDSAREEHAYKRIVKELKNNNIKNLMLLYGREEYLINWAVDIIVNKYVNEVCKEMDFSKLDGSIVTLDQIRNNCETLPFMSEKRVVIVSDFKLIEGAKTKGFNEEDEIHLAEYLRTLPDYCILIIISKSVDKRKRLYKTIFELGGAYEFCELDERSLRSFIEKRLKESGKSARPSVLAQLIATSGYYDKETDYTLYNLENDIKKAIAYNENQEIEKDTVENTISGNIETDVFALIESLSNNRKGEAFQRLHNLLVYGEKEFRLLALLCSHFELILSVREMKDEGISFAEMKNILGVHEFRIKKAAAFAEKYTVSNLRRILQKTYEIDKSIKTGLLEAPLALELFIAEI